MTGSAGTIDALLQVGVAREDQPHYLKVLARPEVDVAPLVDFGLRTTTSGSGSHDLAVVWDRAALRTSYAGL